MIPSFFSYFLPFCRYPYIRRRRRRRRRRTTFETSYFCTLAMIVLCH